MKAPRYHVIIDIGSCRSEPITDEVGLSDFIKGLIKEIDMSILVGPHVAHGIPENPGLSGFAIIDYSHVSIHTFSDHNDAMIDIFSCKLFDRKKAREMCMEYFASEESNVRMQEIWWE